MRDSSKKPRAGNSFRHKLVQVLAYFKSHGGNGVGAKPWEWAIVCGTRLSDRLTHGLIGVGVIFAALGLGEAVDRFTFLDFGGATDRLPMEMLFRAGIRLDDYETGQKDLPHRMETSARITLIRDRYYKIRRAVKAITPLPYPKNQQAIRGIRKEADRIERALTGINASAAASRSFTRRQAT